MSDAAFGIRIFIVAATLFFVLMNYVALKRSEFKWWMLVFSLFCIIVLVLILYPAYDWALKKQKGYAHRSELLNKQFPIKSAACQDKSAGAVAGSYA